MVRNQLAKLAADFQSAASSVFGNIHQYSGIGA